jgi:hypothetical protein
LPSLDAARSRFEEVGGNQFIEEHFKKLFIAMDMDRTFGLTTLHRHFDIGIDQKMVDYNGTSTA